MKKYLAQKQHIQENLKCTVKLLQESIPPEGGKLEGVMVLEAKETVEYSGLFLLLTGQSLQGKEQNAKNLRFTVVESGTEEHHRWGRIWRGGSESYPLELEVTSEELPPPVISAEGKLMYKLIAWLSIPGDKLDKNVWLGDTFVRWRGRRAVTEEEEENGLGLEQTVESTTGLMGLGRERVADLVWSVNKAGFVLEEEISLGLEGTTKEHEGMELEWVVELVQNVGVQVPEGRRLVESRKVNVVKTLEGEGNINGGDDKMSLWSAGIKVPGQLTPTMKWDDVNCVSYALKFKVGAKGESKDSWVTGELPVVIGTRKESENEDDNRGEGKEEVDQYWKNKFVYLKQKALLQKHLRCTVIWVDATLPPKGGKMEGKLYLEATKDVQLAGLFLLLKGLTLKGKKKQVLEKGTTKFPVLGEGPILLEEGTRESFPLKLNIPEELPMPVITSEGKLLYRLQAWVTSEECKKHVWLGNMIVRWMGRRVITAEERNQMLELRQRVETKRALMGFGRRKVAEIMWKIRGAGFVTGESFFLSLWGLTKEREGMEVEWVVELVQKVWYQVLEDSKLVALFKVNVVWKEENRVVIDEGEEHGGRREMTRLWLGRLKVPRTITASYKWDLKNSVSYVLKFKVGVVGESREDMMVGELPFVIGTSREIVEGDNASRFREEEESSENPNAGESRRFRGSELVPNLPDNRELRRSESTNSIDSVISTFQLPPSYSQLSSRRASLETLPPSYKELEERGLLSPYDDHPDFFTPSAPKLT